MKRKNFGLADLFGVGFAGRGDSQMQNAYLRLEHDTREGHPLLRGLEDAPRIIHGVTGSKSRRPRRSVPRRSR